MHPVVEIIIHWIHLIFVIIAVGGFIFLRVAVMPAAEALDEESREVFEKALRKKTLPVIHGSILVLMIAGFANLIRVLTSDGHPQGFILLVMVKVLLAMGVIVGIGMSATKIEGAEGVMKNRDAIMAGTIALALAVILLSAIIRLAPMGG